MSSLNKYMLTWYQRISLLQPIIDKNCIISFICINSFDEKNRNKNDANNKKREQIIVNIINQKIPDEYYRLSLKWTNLKKNINLYIKDLCKLKNINEIEKVKCNPKAGRGNHYDFEIIINDKYNFNVEFKYNTKYVNNTPQFVSAMKPSQYLNCNFENYFYDNYLNQIADFGNLKMPVKEEYLLKIHNNKVTCMEEFKEKYDNNIIFNKFCKKKDKEGIKKFIELSEIKIDKLSEYLLKSQENKHYMCYYNKKFHYDKVDKNLFKITNLVKKENTNYICETETGMKIEIKLRFKNGCGLQFPGFQIKRKIPNVKELQNICKLNNINPPKFKKDILNIMDMNNILY